MKRVMVYLRLSMDIPSDIDPDNLYCLNNKKDFRFAAEGQELDTRVLDFATDEVVVDDE